MGFSTVSSTDQRHDHANLVFRQSKDLSQLLLKTGRILTCGMNHQLSAGLPIGGGGVRLDVAMLNRRQAVDVFQNLIRFLKASLDIAIFNMKNAADVSTYLKIEFLLVDTGVGFITL